MLARGLISGAPLLALDEPAAGSRPRWARAAARGVRPGGRRTARADDPHRHPPHRGAAAHHEPRAAPPRRPDRRCRAARRGADRREPQRLLRAAAPRRAPRAAGCSCTARARRVSFTIAASPDERRSRPGTPPAAAAAPTCAPTRPPTTEPTAISAATPQSTSAANAKTIAATRFVSVASTFLSALTRCSVVGQREPEDGEQQDPLRGAEVAAVDARERGGRRASSGPPCGRARRRRASSRAESQRLERRSSTRAPAMKNGTIALNADAGSASRSAAPISAPVSEAPPSTSDRRP